MNNLPRGIWYEAPRKRYRVKLYKNNVPYLAGYFKTPEEAMHAWSDLVKKLAQIPKLKKGEAPKKRLYPGNSSGIISSARQEKDPNINLKKG